MHLFSDIVLGLLVGRALGQTTSLPTAENPATDEVNVVTDFVPIKPAMMMPRYDTKDVKRNCVLYHCGIKSIFNRGNTSQIVPIKLDDAKLGPNAGLVKVGGKPAIRLSTPANENSSFSVNVKASTKIPTGNLAKIVASIRVGNIGTVQQELGKNPGLIKTGCSLVMLVDGSSVYKQELMATTGEFQEYSSSNFQCSKQPAIDVVHECGDRPSEITVVDAKLAAANNVGSSDEASETNADGDSKATGTSGEDGNGDEGDGEDKEPDDSGSESGSDSGSGSGSGSESENGSGPTSPTNSDPASDGNNGDETSMAGYESSPRMMLALGIPLAVAVLL
ncbi:hypothetical protein FZEAL_7677 [Fusarium zealandicum]|uniref:Uncharacterized protein n=1 Tax=Fusarium zealandicum TaxID=1053134 RepID=A0A8H4UF91_9HYPO|nr:hypothetical protein FZEAL_7677 [Fusarium zealandicum]